MHYLKVDISMEDLNFERYSPRHDVKDGEAVSTQPLHYRDIRWWGLCSNDSCEGVTVGHSAYYHWRLLSATEKDYELPFIDLIRNAQGNNAYYPALMLEFKNTHLHWPTNRLRRWCNGKRRIHLQSQDKIVGQPVDILTDGNFWSSGRVAAISRDAATSASRVSITVKLLEPPTNQQIDTVTVTLGSGRIASYGCMTQLFSPFPSNSVANDNISVRKQSSNIHLTTPTNGELGLNDSNHKSRKVTDLPPLLIALELEISFIQTIHCIRGVDIGKEKLEQQLLFANRLQKRRNMHAQKLKDRQSKRAALRLDVPTNTMTEGGANYGQENNSPVEYAFGQSASLQEGDDGNDEEVDNASGEVSVSSSGGSLGALKKILSRSGSKVIPINGSGNNSPTVEDRDVGTLLQIDGSSPLNR